MWCRRRTQSHARWEAARQAMIGGAREWSGLDPVGGSEGCAGTISAMRWVSPTRTEGIAEASRATSEVVTQARQVDSSWRGAFSGSSTSTPTEAAKPLVCGGLVGATRDTSQNGPVRRTSWRNAARADEARLERENRITLLQQPRFRREHCAAGRQPPRSIVPDDARRNAWRTPHSSPRTRPYQRERPSSSPHC